MGKKNCSGEGERGGRAYSAALETGGSERSGFDLHCAEEVSKKARETFSSNLSASPASAICVRVFMSGRARSLAGPAYI